MKKLMAIAVALSLLGLATSAGAEPFIVARDNDNNSAGAAAPGEWHNNEGAANLVRIKASDHQWYGDWNTEAMVQHIEQNPCPDGMHYEARLCVVPDANEGGYGPPEAFKVAAVWSETDWVEGDGPGCCANYNWTTPTEAHAATHVYAQDIEDPNSPGTSDAARVVNWVHPVNGPCTFLGTFLDQGDNTGMFSNQWAPWLDLVNSVRNTAKLQINPPGDIGNYVCVVLDDALLQDLLYNENNRGLVIYDLPPGNFNNHNIRTLEYAGSEPYIELVCVPEPATMLLLAAGAVALIRRRR